MISQSERRLYGRLGALRVHAKGATNTTAARAAFAAKFYADIPEDLSEAERDRRAGFARRAFYVELALASVQSRRARARSERPETPSPAVPESARQS